MKKLTKALALCLLTGASLTAVQASADNCCFDPCRDWCSFDGCWEVGAQALYWKPCLTRWTYAATESDGGPVTINTPRVMKSDYDWGFRVFGKYYSCDGCEWASIGWTYLHTHDALTFRPTSAQELTVSTVTSDDPGGAIVLEEVAFATAKLRNRYNKVNFRYGRNIACVCRSRFWAYGGARYMNIEVNRLLQAFGEEQTNGDNSFLLTNEKSELNGFGLELGFGGEYDIGCGLNLVGQVGFVAGLGEKKRHYEATLINADDQPNTVARTVKTRDPSQWGCVPGLDFNIGINYVWDCDCWSLVGELGWHGDFYWRAVSQHEEFEATSISRLDNIAFQGPYASLSLRF